MKLLLITQKVDLDDPVLGFFHRWIDEFARSAEEVIVICLYEGRHNLPKNVKVLSLGKEDGASRLKYVLRFYRYIWKERKNYDSVFVHMNQVYVLLGWKIWKFFGKKIVLWYNHKKGTFFTRFAVLFSNHVLYTSTFAFTARFKKSIKMPVGIDTDFFLPLSSVKKKEHTILSLGRISEVKNIDVFVKALHILHKRDVNFSASIYGSADTKDRKYERQIRIMSRALEEAGKLTFHEAVSNNETPRVYHEHEIYVNATGQGSFDKTIIEAMACGNIVIACNKTLNDALPRSLLFKEGSSPDLAGKIQTALTLSGKERSTIEQNLREHAVARHDLKSLIEQIFTIMQYC